MAMSADNEAIVRLEKAYNELFKLYQKRGRDLYDRRTENLKLQTEINRLRAKYENQTSS